MGYEMRADYSQQWLFPPAVEDWVPADHPARFLREFVDALDLVAEGFTARTSVEGRPSFAADLLLKVWLYGYLNHLRTTRPLERACREHLSLVWLTGRHYPDHNTLWRFWRDNQAPLRRVFTQALRVAAQCKLVGMVLHAVDGTKIAAQASREGLRTRAELERVLAALDDSVEQGMAAIEAAEAAEQARVEGAYCLPPELVDAARRRERVRELLGVLATEQREKLTPHEPEAALMKTRGSGIVPCYNAQAVTDADSGLVVAAEVVTAPSDDAQLVPMLDAVQEQLGGVAADTVADGGYADPAQLAAAQERGYAVVVNLGAQRAPAAGTPGTEYHSARFQYDAERDCCVCPRGEMLRLERRREARGHRDALRVYRCQAFKSCPVRWACSRNQRGRTIELSVHDSAVRAQRVRQSDPHTRALLRRRAAVAEKTFGTIKAAMGFRRWTVRGLEAVRTQWALVCTAFNLKKLYPAWRAGTLVCD